MDLSGIVTLFSAQDAVSMENFNARLSQINAGAAPQEHTHTMQEVQSGVLPAAQGGTGQTSLQAARNAMGLGNTTGALPVANGGTGQTSLSAVAVGAAGRLSTARTIGMSGGATATATAFDGSANITIPVTGLDMGYATAGTLPAARGGTGQTSLEDVTVGGAKALVNGTKSAPMASNGTVTFPYTVDARSGAVYGRNFLQNPETYNAPNELGQYLDMHVSQSSSDYDARIGVNLAPSYYLYIQNPNLASQTGAVVCSPNGKVLGISVMTQAAYDSLQSPDPKMLYMIVG